MNMTTKCFYLIFLFVGSYCHISDAWITSNPPTFLPPLTRTSLHSQDSNMNEQKPPAPVLGVTLKIAVDSKGAAADLGDTIQERFTCAASLDMVHRLRASCQAVLVGKGTVQADNPSLLVRRNITVTQQPLRVVLDPSLSLFTPSSPSYQMFQDGYATVVFHARTDWINNPEVNNAVQFRYVPRSDDGNISLLAVLHILSDEFHVHHLMVEGGPFTAQQFLRHKLVDRCIRVQAPIEFTDQPLDAGMTDTLLQDTAGLVYLGSTYLGVDTVTYWSRPRQPWPSPHLEDWP